VETGLNERFILAEDAALKRKLEGIKVTYPRERDVSVWFRWPNKETRETGRPFITIDLIDVVKSDHREHSGGPFPLDYEPHGYESTIEEDTGLAVAEDWPIPYDLYYAVTTWASDPRHDRQLLARLLGDRGLIPHRMGFLEIPEDGTTRRLDTLSVTDNTGRDSNNDVEFRRTFTLRVESELFTAFVNDVLIPGRLVIELSDTESDLTEVIETDLIVY
jgi:hypothetical protein